MIFDDPVLALIAVVPLSMIPYFFIYLGIGMLKDRKFNVLISVLPIIMGGISTIGILVILFSRNQVDVGFMIYAAGLFPLFVIALGGIVLVIIFPVMTIIEFVENISSKPALNLRNLFFLSLQNLLFIVWLLLFDISMTLQFPNRSKESDFLLVVVIAVVLNIVYGYLEFVDAQENRFQGEQLGSGHYARYLLTLTTMLQIAYLLSTFSLLENWISIILLVLCVFAAWLWITPWILSKINYLIDNLFIQAHITYDDDDIPNSVTIKGLFVSIYSVAVPVLWMVAASFSDSPVSKQPATSLIKYRISLLVTGMVLLIVPWIIQHFVSSPLFMNAVFWTGLISSMIYQISCVQFYSHSPLAGEPIFWASVSSMALLFWSLNSRIFEKNAYG